MCALHRCLQNIIVHHVDAHIIIIMVLPKLRTRQSNPKKGRLMYRDDHLKERTTTKESHATASLISRRR